MIAYKVVEKGTRFGSNVTINKHDNFPYATKREKKGILKLRRENNKWFPKYFKGTVVKMAPDSVGILAFRTIGTAKEFRNHHHSLSDYAVIIQVKVIGELLPKARLISACAKFEHLLGIIVTHDMSAPEGTIFCRAVEVLE